MKQYSMVLLIVIGLVPALAQNKQADKQPMLFHRQGYAIAPKNLAFLFDGQNLLTTPHASVIPMDVPTQFNEGLITAEEQLNSKEIDGLTSRISTLEERANFASGAFWAIGIVFTSLMALLGLFWKPLAKVIVAEAVPPRPGLFG